MKRKPASPGSGGFKEDAPSAPLAEESLELPITAGGEVFADTFEEEAATMQELKSET